MKLLAIRLLSLFSLLILGACSTTQVQESWRLPGYQPDASPKVLVVAMASKDSMRKLVESSFATQLEQRGITAIPSFQWVADGTRLNRDSLQPLVRQNGITAVLVTSIKDVQKSTAYQPSQGNVPNDGLFRSMDTYYAYSSSGQHESGSYATLTDYLIETNLFDSRNSKLSWSVTTRTSETGSLRKAVDEVVKTTLKQAAKDGVIQGKN